MTTYVHQTWRRLLKLNQRFTSYNKSALGGRKGQKDGMKEVVRDMHGCGTASNDNSSPKMRAMTRASFDASIVVAKSETSGWGSGGIINKALSSTPGISQITVR